jgi:hypothetical protein
MDCVLTDCFVVYAHRDGFTWEPREVERELAACGTYEEAVQIKLERERSGQHCVIRFVGPTGGGD